MFHTDAPGWGGSVVWSLVTEAVAVAISMQQYDLALEWLEQGRSILWGQVLQIPTPFDGLYAGNLELVKQLQRLLYQPEYSRMPGSVGRPPADDRGSLPEQAWKDRLAKRKDILEFMRLPGLEGSLRPPEASELRSLVLDGAAVILNLCKDRCDALVIQAGTREIAHIPLISFSLQKAESARGKLVSCLGTVVVSPVPIFSDVDPRITKFKDLLAGLWYDVVKPVLDHLKITKVKPVDKLPHLTWCITGPHSFLPLHAAGDYRSPSTFAQSTYLISRHILGPPRCRASDTVGPRTRSGLDAGDELRQVQIQAKGLPFTWLDEETTPTNTVLKDMADHSWVHFASRVSQDSADPTKNALHLHDGDLTLATIARNPFKNVQLAFLSSCETAIERSVSLHEPFPFATGLLMTGYPTVITTMWPRTDLDAPLVARKVYECLLEGGVPDSRKAAKALHKAVATLREKVGMDQFERWVPYVHIGH